MWVRTATEQDLEAISELLRIVWHDTYDDIYGIERVAEITASWHSVGALHENLKAPHSEFLVADDGKKIAGMAYARQVDERTVKLNQLYVSPHAQGKGVGAMLIEEVEESFFDVPEIMLEVEGENKNAIRFYEKHGFIETDTTGNCGEADSGIEALIFTKVR